MNNRIFNAVQAMDGHGEIRIETWMDPTWAWIKISDTGHGISEADLKKVFSPGFTTKGVGAGTGLGLSLCYNIIQKHSGKIEVESKMGKGTTFTMCIPRTQQTGETRETPP